MTIASAISELTKPAKEAADQLDHPAISSTRLWVTVGFGIAVVWLAKGILVESTLWMLTITVNTYIVCNTVSRIFQLRANAALKPALRDTPKAP